MAVIRGAPRRHFPAAGRIFCPEILPPLRHPARARSQVLPQVRPSGRIASDKQTHSQIGSPLMGRPFYLEDQRTMLSWTSAELFMTDQAETASRFEAPNWVAVSGCALFGKAYPVLSRNSGSQFPLGAPTGKRVPAFGQIVGRTFRSQAVARIKNGCRPKSAPVNVDTRRLTCASSRRARRWRPRRRWQSEDRLRP